MKSHIFKIDILRGVAILGVFLYHSQLVCFPNYEVNNYNSENVINILNLKGLILNFNPIAFGWLGVQLFLLISGFCIHLGFLNNNEKLELSIFFSKRFWRIYPNYFIILLFFCFFIGENGFNFHSKIGEINFISHLFLFHNFFNDTYFSINPSFWSLALEVQLYIIYPLLIVLRNKIGIKNTLLILIGISFLLLFLGIIYKSVGNALWYESSVLKLWFIWGAGSFLAEKYYNNERIFKNGLIIIIVGGILTILSKLHLYSNYFTIYLGSLTLLAFFEWFLDGKFRTTNSLISKIMALIGICSYSIYLIHQPYLSQIFKFFNFFPTKNINHYIKIIEIVPAFLILFLVSYLIYLFIELPSIKLGYLTRKINILKINKNDKKNASNLS